MLDIKFSILLYFKKGKIWFEKKYHIFFSKYFATINGYCKIFVNNKIYYLLNRDLLNDMSLHRKFFLPSIHFTLFLQFVLTESSKSLLINLLKVIKTIE